jgi:hypothetical protein
MRIFWNIHQFSDSESVDADINVVDVRDLADGYNDPKVVWSKLLSGYCVLLSKKRVGYRCAAGISRSNALAMGLISLYYNIEFDDAYNIVRALVPRANPNQDILRAVKDALAFRGS